MTANKDFSTRPLGLQKIITNHLNCLKARLKPCPTQVSLFLFFQRPHKDWLTNIFYLLFYLNTLPKGGLSEGV